MAKRLLIIAAILLFPFYAGAQIQPGQGVTQSGSVTPGHCMEWLGANVAEDAGGACTTGGDGYLPLGGGTLTGALLFTDNSYDIGASGATRPRTGYFGTSVVTPVVDMTGSALVFKSGGVTGTLNWAPSSSNKSITFPNGTTDFTATGGTSQVVKQSSAGAPLTVGQLSCSDISDAGAGCSGTNSVSSFVVNATYDLTTASGTQTVSGFGFTPSSCDGFGTITNSTPGTYITYNAHVDSALNQNAIYDFAGLRATQSGIFFTAAAVSGIDYQQAVVSAYGSGTVTLTWTKTGSPTGTFRFSLRCFQ